MKTRLMAAIIVGCGTLAFPARSWADDAKKAPPPDPLQKQQQLRRELIRKYDLNKDGRIDKDEAHLMSQADQRAFARTASAGVSKKALKDGTVEAETNAAAAKEIQKEKALKEALAKEAGAGAAATETAVKEAAARDAAAKTAKETADKAAAAKEAAAKDVAGKTDQ